MEIMASFRKVEMSISRTNSRGAYKITAEYKGCFVVAHTTDSEAFDWLEDDSNKEKHQDAKRHCYFKIKAAFENN
jgi:hypothetical protein